MFTLRNIGGVAFFLAGTTWVWLTSSFAGRGVSRSGTLWLVTNALCLLTMAVFLVATWGLFTRASWWEGVAVVGAVIGLVSLIPYWVASTNGGEAVGTVAYNSFLHVLMAVGVLVLLVVPVLEHWVDGQVMTG